MVGIVTYHGGRERFPDAAWVSFYAVLGKASSADFGRQRMFGVGACGHEAVENVVAVGSAVKYTLALPSEGKYLQPLLTRL